MLTPRTNSGLSLNGARSSGAPTGSMGRQSGGRTVPGMTPPGARPAPPPQPAQQPAQQPVRTAIEQQQQGQTGTAANGVNRYGLFAGGGSGYTPSSTGSPQQQLPTMAPGAQVNVGVAPSNTMPLQTMTPGAVIAGSSTGVTGMVPAGQPQASVYDPAAGMQADPRQDRGTYDPTTGQITYSDGRTSSAQHNLHRGTVLEPIVAVADYLTDGGFTAAQGTVTEDIHGTDLNGDGTIGGGVVQAGTEVFEPLVSNASELWKQLEQAWGTTPEALGPIMDILNQFGFNPSSLTGALGQNAQAMMDPAAWQQMADNRMAAHRDQARGDLNDMERRTRGAAARGGFNPTAGLNNAYSQYAQSNQDAQRNIFNDALGHQMNAFNTASGYGLGQQGLDQSRWGQGLGMLGQAGMFDAANRAGDFTNFGEMVGGVGDLVGSVLHGGGQSGGGIASMLPMLLAL